jgi:hypothetical protein
MLAALPQLREREITDALVELLITTVHRIDARAQRNFTNERGDTAGGAAEDAPAAGSPS